jgi:hypothetical protein
MKKTGRSASQTLDNKQSDICDDNRHTLRYDFAMKTFRWNHEKNEQLKLEREISFEEIVLALEGDGLFDILQHPNESKYPNQRILVVALDDYVFLVPYVEESDYYFLKTIIPSRKATRDYLAGGNRNEKA